MWEATCPSPEAAIPIEVVTILWKGTKIVTTLGWAGGAIVPRVPCWALRFGPRFVPLFWFGTVGGHMTQVVTVVTFGWGQSIFGRQVATRQFFVLRPPFQRSVFRGKASLSSHECSKIDII